MLPTLQKLRLLAQTGAYSCWFWNKALYKLIDILYPPELTLSRTDKDGIQADYLDLDISISGNGFFNCDLFDKRDDFKFKVINYPCLNFSNIPVQPAYGIYLSQLLRICRICSDINNFYIAISKITKEFLLKGFNKCILF